MPGTLSTVYRRSGEVVHRRIADETLLVPVKGNLASLHKIFALNPVSDFVWQELATEQPLANIADKLTERFDVEAERAQSDLLELLSAFEQALLVSEVAK